METASDVDARERALTALGIDLCYRQTGANHFGALVPYLAVLIFLTPVATSGFWAWALLMPLYVLASFALHLAYRRRPEGAAVGPWGRRLLVHNAFMGLFSGAFLLFVDIGSEASLTYLAMLLLVGPWFGAAVITAPYPPVFPVWIGSQVAIVAYVFWRQGEPWVLSALMLLALVASVVLWRNAAALTRRSAALRFENLDLARQARAAAEAKSRYLAAVSHDLRQPLHALGLFQGALAERLQETEARTLLRHAEAAREETVRMLDGLAELSRLERAHVAVRHRVLPLRPWLRPLVEEVRPLAEAKGLVLRWRCPALEVESDAQLLRRMLRNLLVNAVNHTRRGGVLLGVRRRGAWVRITVWDSGPGIAAADRARIFDPFVRLHPGGSGQGLGLAIVRQFARVLDHPLQLRSRPGRGSAFSIDVPLAMEGDPWVLVLDDDPESRWAVATLLRTWGLRVRTRARPEEAFAVTTPPAWVVTDFHLAEGDGLAALGRLEAHFRRPLPALVISGDETAAAQAASAGRPFLPKPVAPGRLRAALARALQ